MDTPTPGPSAVQSVNPQIEERKSPSFLQKYKFTLISLCIILIALIPLIILSRNHKSQPQTITQQSNITPTAAPLTEQNAEPTLDAVDTKIQDALNQTDQDLNQVSQVNSSQDSTAGL